VAIVKNAGLRRRIGFPTSVALNTKETWMPFDTRKILFERFVVRRTRQRAASAARAKESLRSAIAHVEVPVQVVVPATLRKYHDASVRRLIASGKRRGFVTFEEANDILPASEISPEEIEAFIEAIIGLGFELREC
jgi:hypothetical protein